jgi:hypothetical protein
MPPLSSDGPDQATRAVNGYAGTRQAAWAGVPVTARIKWKDWVELGQVEEPEDGTSEKKPVVTVGRESAGDVMQVQEVPPKSPAATIRTLEPMVTVNGYREALMRREKAEQGRLF